MSLLNDTAPVSARQYWRSLDEMAETPEFKQFVEREFPAFASEMSSPFTRRTFLSLMGASMALAGMVTGCRKPVHNIVPYSKQPENTTPGLPTFYATSFACAGQVVGTLARTFEGRPVKLEGNPDFPTTLGALDGFTQALILQLYDPDRSMFPRNKGRQAEPEAARQALAGLGATARGKRGAGLRILSEPTTSPTLLALRAAFQAALPEAQWHVWEPVNQDAALAGAAAALGQPLQAHVDFSKANVVVALDSDFLSQGPETLLHQKQFSRRRKPELGPMNRLYSIECMFSVTGGMADHRLRLAPGEIDTFARALAAGLGVSEAQTTNPILPARAKEWLAPLAKDVRANAGKCAFVVGPQASAAVHALATALNVMFGAECVRFTQPIDVAAVNQLASLTELTRAMGQGSVETLVILGGNPVYNAPADLKFGDVLKRVPNSVHLGLYNDETAQACAWHLPEAHVLESWGDVQAFDGTVGLTQPLIAPLFGGLTAGEVVSILFESPVRTAYDIVYQHHSGTQTAAAFDATWRKCLHDGMVPAKGATFTEVSRSGQGLAELLKTAPAAAPTQESLSVQLLVSPTLHDGRFANNGWLMEMPHPTTKLTWDNAAYLSEQTARQLKLKTEDVVRLTTTAGELELPVYILPGIADFCVVVHLGYGRTAGGRIANGVGANAYMIRNSQALYTLDKVKATRTSRVYQLANVQDHWSMENRPLVLEGGIKEYEAHPHELVAPAAAEHGAEHGPTRRMPRAITKKIFHLSKSTVTSMARNGP
jgi:molybdopterin-containing oxidoreductase family iron-sulfur binding subunit